MAWDDPKVENSGATAFGKLTASEWNDMVTDQKTRLETILTSVALGEIIKFDGTNWINNTLSEADLMSKSAPVAGGEFNFDTHSAGFTAQTATGDGTTTIDWKLGNKFNFTFGAFNETFTFTAPTKPGNFTLKMTQDGVGSRTATFPASVKWSGGTAPTLSTAASSVDIISFYFDGTNFYAQEVLDLS